jgi:hypothetical protein
LKKKFVNPNDPTAVKKITKKQQLSNQRRVKKYEQADANHFYTRTPNFKEKMFCVNDELDLYQDLENEHRINQSVKDEIASEELRKAREELAEIWLQQLIKASQEDSRYVTQTESEVLCFMEKHDVDPAQKQYAEESLQQLISDSKRYAYIDSTDYDSDSSSEDWRIVCWH